MVTDSDVIKAAALMVWLQIEDAPNGNIMRRLAEKLADHREGAVQKRDAEIAVRLQSLESVGWHHREMKKLIAELSAR